METIKKKPTVGDTRTKSGFLFLPMSVYNRDYETTRWLEFAKWEETYKLNRQCHNWELTRFLD